MNPSQAKQDRLANVSVEAVWITWNGPRMRQGRSLCLRLRIPVRMVTIIALVEATAGTVIQTRGRGRGHRRVLLLEVSSAESLGLPSSAASFGISSARGALLRPSSVRSSRCSRHTWAIRTSSRRRHRPHRHTQPASSRTHLTRTSTTRSWMPQGCQGQDPSWVRPTISGSKSLAMAAVTRGEASRHRGRRRRCYVDFSASAFNQASV